MRAAHRDALPPGWQGALAAGKQKDAQQQSMRAKQLLPKNGASYLRADEIGREAEHLDD